MVDVSKETKMLGGAANVLNNIASLGGKPILCGIVGEDGNGRRIIDIIEDMDVHERAAVVESLEEEVVADALEEMDPKVQVAIIGSLEPDKAADIIEEMSPDEAADLIAELFH